MSLSMNTEALLHPKPLLFTRIHRSNLLRMKDWTHTLILICEASDSDILAIRARQSTQIKNSAITECIRKFGNDLADLPMWINQGIAYLSINVLPLSDSFIEKWLARIYTKSDDCNRYKKTLSRLLDVISEQLDSTNSDDVLEQESPSEGSESSSYYTDSSDSESSDECTDEK